MAIVHETRYYATTDRGVVLDRQAAALAYAELSRDEVRHELDGGANLRFVDGAALADELAQAHGRIAELEAAQGRARAAQTPFRPRSDPRPCLSTTRRTRCLRATSRSSRPRA